MSHTSRTALLIRCSVSEAAIIRAAARDEDRTISGYVLHVLRKAWPIEEWIRENLEMVRGPNLRATTNTPVTRWAERPAGPRTALLIRCGVDEANRIRATARQKHMSLNAYVLEALGRNWRVHVHLQERLEEFRRVRFQTNSVLKSAKRTWRARPAGGKPGAKESQES